MKTIVAKLEAGSTVLPAQWTVCALLFFATTLNYVDRQVLSILAKTLETQIGWSTIQYGYITAAFQASYAIGLLAAGRLIDRLGTRVGFALAVAVWSLAAMAHATATSALTFGFARAALGFGEAANFPACIKTVAEWFPKRDRAFATGVLNSGATAGAILAPLTMPFLAAAHGWQSAFLATGATGFIWIAIWYRLYARPEDHPDVTSSDLAMIRSDAPDSVTSIPWLQLLAMRETWAYAAGKFLTDPVWWFFLFWFPKYLQETFNLTLEQIMLPTMAAYGLAGFGSIAGGWLSSTLIRRGWSVNAGRKTAFLVCGVCVLPVLYAPYSMHLWLTVFFVGLALAAHQGFSANLYTITSDMFPRTVVGSVVGIGGMAGMLASTIFQIAAGYIVERTHSYLPLFLISGVAYLLALAAVHVLAPKLEPARFTMDGGHS